MSKVKTKAELELDRKILIFEYEVACDNLELKYSELLKEIDDKLFNINRIGFRYENTKNTSKLRSSKDRKTIKRQDKD